MHKGFSAYSRSAILMTAMILFTTTAVRGQSRGDKIHHSRLLEIQESYVRGEVDVNTAVLQQFKWLYDPKAVRDEALTHEKCITPAFMFLHQHRGELSESTVHKVQEYQAKREKPRVAVAEESYITPSGKFEIIYHVSGTDSVSIDDENDNGIPDYIDRVAEAADSSYRHEILNIGFTDPIPEGQQYKVYVQNDLPQEAYGYTELKSGSPGGTIIYIESDFDGFPENSHPKGNQVGSIYVTIAHEFKHAIQYAQNRWRSPSGGFDWSEMDATLMEEVVYDDVNDYYNYIKVNFKSTNPDSRSVFGNPNNSAPNAYWFASWMIYYSEAYGNELWRDVWASIEENNFMGIEEALAEHLPKWNTYFEESFVQNHLWHFASGPRAGSIDYGFEEKEFYPNANTAVSFDEVPISKIELNSINKLAAKYIEIDPALHNQGMIEVAVDYDSSQVGLGLLLFLKNGEVIEQIDTSENKPQLYLSTNVNWQDVEKLGIVVANYDNSTSVKNVVVYVSQLGNAIPIKDPDIPNQIRVYQNYPNPFNAGTTISFELPRNAFVKIDVFDITGRKVASLTNETYPVGRHVVPFNASQLSSGVYLYRMQIDDMSFIKKMTLLK